MHIVCHSLKDEWDVLRRFNAKDSYTINAREDGVYLLSEFEDAIARVRLNASTKKPGAISLPSNTNIPTNEIEILESGDSTCLIYNGTQICLDYQPPAYYANHLTTKSGEILFSVHAKQLNFSMGKIFAVVKDFIRGTHSSSTPEVYFEPAEDYITVVSTDRRRLIATKMQAEIYNNKAFAVSSKHLQKALQALPKRGPIEVYHLSADCDYYIFCCHNIQITIPVYARNFYRWKNIIPDENLTNKFIVDAEHLKRALKHLNSDKILLQTEGEGLILKSSQSRIPVCCLSLDIQKSYPTYINGKYLLSIIQYMTGNLSLKTVEGGPLVVVSEDDLGLLAIIKPPNG